MAKRRVLVVDDSPTFRRVATSALNAIDGYEVVGQAADGIEALAYLTKNTVDLITLDLEMPRMGGSACILAMRKLGIKARVLVFSATTRQGADVAVEAMSNGADDFVAKPIPQAAGETAQEAVRGLLLGKLAQFWPPSGNHDVASVGGPVTHGAAVTSTALWRKFAAQAVVIAASTGGPVALEKLFRSFGTPTFHCPVFVVQHMPPVFTASLAKRLSTLTGRTVREALHEETPQAGAVYVCPGDFHMRVLRARDGVVKIFLDQKTPSRNFVRPAADYLFETAAQAYGRRCLGVVMTGMGSDGRDGALAIKKAAGAVVIQEPKSCAVFGMPKAVYDTGAYDFMGTAEELGAVVSAAAG